MATKGYVSNRFPYLQIGNHIRFQGGLFETDDETLQALVEQNEWFNVHIHPRDHDTELPDLDQPRVRHGGRGTR